MPEVDALLQQLRELGFAWVRGRRLGCAEAFATASALVDARRASNGESSLSVVGEFVLPPPDGHESRDFQTLHFDFGVPLNPKLEADVGRYTALHIPNGFGPVSAMTRIVPLAPLLGQRTWPSGTELVARLIAYGETHGGWRDDHGYVEGSLARVVEAAAGMPALPSVKAAPGFLCGTEFESLDAELRFFERHSLRVDEVQIEVALSPGELLVFDNLAVAHGRRGVRRPGELHQWVFGERSLGTARQLELRDDLLDAFRMRPAADHSPAGASVSMP
jgi:hypothetical protein